MGEGRKVRMFFNLVLVDKALLAGSGNQFPEKIRCFHDNNVGSSRSPGLVLQSFPVPFSSGPSRNLKGYVYIIESVCNEKRNLKKMLFFNSSLYLSQYLAEISDNAILPILSRKLYSSKLCRLQCAKKNNSAKIFLKVSIKII